MNNLQTILRTFAEQTDAKKQTLLEGAERRYHHRMTELQRSYAEECAEINASFGDAFGVAEQPQAAE